MHDFFIRQVAFYITPASTEDMFKIYWTIRPYTDYCDLDGVSCLFF